jgi:hypothetical protein
MKWTMGLLLLAAAGCGYRQTRMVACPNNGCAQTYASSSPQGLRTNPPPERVAPMPEPTLPPPEAPTPIP